MRILLVHNRYRSTSPSGEDRVVDQEHAALQAAGHVVGRFERSSDEIADFGLPRKALLPVDAVWSQSAARDIGATISSFEPDVAHLHNLFPLVSPSVLRTFARRGVPCVVTVHNYLPICAGGELQRQGRSCTQCVDRRLPLAGVWHGCYHGSSPASAVMALSTAVNRETWRTVPSAFVFLSEAQRALFAPLELPTARCFVKDNLVPPTVRRTSTEDLIVFIGRLAEVKGIRVLMRAWDDYLAADAGPKFRLAVAGAGPLEGELRAWASARASVEVHGLLDRGACSRLVARATAVVAPAEWREPFGLVVAEAMAAGVGPVASALGAYPELIEDGVDGLLHAPGDHRALADRIRLLERSPSLVASLGNGARRTYERRFTPAAVVSQLEAVYRYAVDHPAGPRCGPARAPGHLGVAPVTGAAVPLPTPVDAGDEDAVAAFWQAHPCGDAMVGGLSERYRHDYERFFADYDRHRYSTESHIPGCLDRLALAGSRVLEIGLGQGAESEQLIRRGARWTGLDLTAASVDRVRTRLELRALPYEAILHGSVTDIPADSASFDLVFSHGVLHHVPDINTAQREIHRVLRPGGRLVVMLYARGSLNYWVSIGVLRRLAVVGTWPVRRWYRSGMLGAHLRNAERLGLLRYLRMAQFLHANTDGPDNPHSRVYDAAAVRRDFPLFTVLDARKHFLHAPPLPVRGLPGARLMGWHLWVDLARRDDGGNEVDPAPI